MKKYFCFCLLGIMSFGANACFIYVPDGSFEKQHSSLNTVPSAWYNGDKKIDGEVENLPVMQVRCMSVLLFTHGDVFEIDYSVHDHHKRWGQYRQVIYRHRRSLQRHRKNSLRHLHEHPQRRASLGSIRCINSVRIAGLLCGKRPVHLQVSGKWCRVLENITLHLFSNNSLTRLMSSFNQI